MTDHPARDQEKGMEQAAMPERALIRKEPHHYMVAVVSNMHLSPLCEWDAEYIRADLHEAAQKRIQVLEGNEEAWRAQAYKLSGILNEMTNCDRDDCRHVACVAVRETEDIARAALEGGKG